jgi:signal transduction histidine kinase
VATIHHRPGSRGRVAAAVTPSIALALETQLVLRDANAQVVELERSRAAAVHLTDDSRRNLERNLHDGAQQRLLVVGMQLANASDEGPLGSQRRSAAGLVADALHELRRIGRGDAAIIAELGLENAVTSLAGSSDLPVWTQTLNCDEADHDCWPLTPATTAYRLLVAAIVEAQQGAATGLSAAFRCCGAGQDHTVSIEHDGAPAADRSSQRDRVLAAGGRIEAGDSTGSTFKVWLP